MKKKINKRTVKLIAASVLCAVIFFEIGVIVKSNIDRIERDNERLAQVLGTNHPKQPEQPLKRPAEQPTEQPAEQPTEQSKSSRIIVLDPGHGKSSSLMSNEEKIASGWKQNSRGAWGEWRHFKMGSGNIDCEGSGCNGRVTPNGGCWYPIGSGDRATEPDINLQNATAARKYLEQMGYVVRMTRTTNDENPSITRRLEYCYPNLDKTKEPDADLFLCVHSNAGGGRARGSAYIQLEGPYDQKWISPTYAEDGNRLGKVCNSYIVNNTSLSMTGGGVIGGEPQLIAFMKSPVTCGYLEIGFFDNQTDLSILKSESDAIGRAIAMGIDAYFNGEQ